MCCLANAIFNHIMSKYTAEDRNEAFLYEDNCSYPTKEDKWKLSLGGNISFRSRSRQGRPVQGRDNQIGSVHLVNGARSTDSANVRNERTQRNNYKHEGRKPKVEADAHKVKLALEDELKTVGTTTGLGALGRSPASHEGRKVPSAGAQAPKAEEDADMFILVTEDEFKTAGPTTGLGAQPATRAGRRPPPGRRPPGQRQAPTRPSSP